MSQDNIERNDCGICGGEIHLAVTRDERSVWVHDDKQSLTEWLNNGGNTHAAVPANLKGAGE